MRTILGIKQLEKPISQSILTIGNFDGLHLGHRKIISRVTEMATSLNTSSVVMTFDPHPRQVLFPDLLFKRLFTREDLQAQLAAAQVKYLVIEPFSRALSQMEPQDFIQECVVKPFNPKALVVGYDFSFGADRTGTLKVLESIMQSLKIDLVVVPPLKHQDKIISSTLIRNTITNGEVVLASEFLGRNFYVEGLVERGDGRGRTIGFPTANINLRSPLTPKQGVYSGWLHFKGRRFKSIANIGIGPTFHKEGDPVKFEVHIFDYNQDLYGETVSFEFHNRIRDEMKFSSAHALVEQIKKDIVVARHSLAS